MRTSFTTDPLKIPEILGQTNADKVLFCLVRSYPRDKHKSDIVKECDMIEGSMNLTVIRLKQNGVLTRTGPGRYKVVSLYRYKQVFRSTEVLFKMFDKHGIKPADELLLPLSEIQAPASTTTRGVLHELPVQPMPTLPPPQLSDVTRFNPQVSECDERLTTFVENFIQSIRTKLERFEQDLAAQDY